MSMTARQALAHAINSTPRKDLEDLIYAARVGYHRVMEWAEGQLPKMPPEAYKKEKKEKK